MKRQNILPQKIFFLLFPIKINWYEQQNNHLPPDVGTGPCCLLSIKFNYHQTAIVGIVVHRDIYHVISTIKMYVLHPCV